MRGLDPIIGDKTAVTTGDYTVTQILNNGEQMRIYFFDGNQKIASFLQNAINPHSAFSPSENIKLLPVQASCELIVGKDAAAGIVRNFLYFLTNTPLQQNEALTNDPQEAKKELASLCRKLAEQMEG